MRLGTPSIILTLLVATAGSAGAQQQIKARVMVLIDTSGSMLWHFNNNVGCGGDGSISYRDNFVGPLAYYPGNDGINSRLYGAKKALTDVVSGAGDLDFGLMRYATDPNGCPDPLRNCCTFANPRCKNGSPINGTQYIDENITWYGGCGPIAGGLATNGGQVVVQPSQVNGNSTVLKWIDNREDFRDNGSGWPVDGELRAEGPTPLAGSARTALGSWYGPVWDVSKQGSVKYNPNDPNFDPQLDCRPYVLVMMTDGADTCDNDITNGPPNAVAALYAKNPQNPVKTYVIGVAIANQNEVAVLNAMAQSGGTSQARADLYFNPVNDAPTLIVPAAQSVLEGEPLSFAVTAFDVESDQTLTLTATNLPNGASFPTTTGLGTVSARFSHCPA